MDGCPRNVHVPVHEDANGTRSREVGWLPDSPNLRDIGLHGAPDLEGGAKFANRSAGMGTSTSTSTSKRLSRKARAIGWTLSEKVNGEARSGSLSVSVSKVRGMGFGHEKPASKSVLLRY